MSTKSLTGNIEEPLVLGLVEFVLQGLRIDMAIGFDEGRDINLWRALAFPTAPALEGHES